MGEKEGKKKKKKEKTNPLGVRWSPRKTTCSDEVGARIGVGEGVVVVVVVVVGEGLVIKETLGTE